MWQRVGWLPLIPPPSPHPCPHHGIASFLPLHRRSNLAGPGTAVASEQYCSPVDYFQGRHAACFAQVQRHYQGDVEGLRFFGSAAEAAHRSEAGGGSQVEAAEGGAVELEEGSSSEEEEPEAALAIADLLGK